MNDMVEILVPIWQLPILGLLPLAVFGTLVIGLRRLIRTRQIGQEDPDWSVPPIGDAAGNTLFHRWDVRCKIIAMLVYAFFITGLTHTTPALMAVALSVLAIVMARSSWSRLLMRMLAIAGFVLMFLIIMPFTVPRHSGDTVLVFQGFTAIEYNLRGLHLAAVIAIKAVAITLLMEPLIATAPLPVTLHGLSRLGAPHMLGQMLLLSHRYLHVFRSEARRMSAGMQVRGFHKRSDLATLKAMANFMGMLFVRSLERTEHVFEAMQARGYQGRFPEPVDLRVKPRDLVFAGIWAGSGLGLLLWDRLAW